MRTQQTISINSQLQIVKLNGQKFPAIDGYYMPKGFTFKHSELGYFAFKGENCLYTPKGGKSVLQSILDAGGFMDFILQT